MIYEGLLDGLEGSMSRPVLSRPESQSQQPGGLARRTGLFTGRLLAALMEGTKPTIASGIEPLVGYCSMRAGEWAGETFEQASERDLLTVHTAGCVRAEMHGQRLAQDFELRLFGWLVGCMTPDRVVTADLTSRVLEWRLRRIRRMAQEPRTDAA